MKSTWQRAALAALAAALLAHGGAVGAAAANEAPGKVKREVIPGSELMTSQEREQYRQRMRAAGSPAEEEKVRAEHRRGMQERARLRGLRLPEPATGGGK